MKNTDKTKELLLKENDQLKAKIVELEKSESKRRHAKQIEEERKESEKQLQTLINAMPDFVCFKDGDGRWLKVNDAGIRIFQLEGVDYQGKNDSELAELNSKLQGSFLTCKKSDARAWKEGNIIHGEEIIPDSDGLIRIFDVTKVPVIWSDGERKGLVVLGHDITERKQAEELLQKNEAQLRQIIDIVPHFIFSKDRNGRFIMANKAAAEGSGTTPENMVGKTHPELLGADPKQYESYLADDCKVIDSGKLKFIPEEDFTYYNGSKVIMETTKIPFTSVGIPAVLGVSIDITQRKKIEAELKDKIEKLEKWKKLTVGREIKMIELKKEINALLKKNGFSEKYEA